VEVSSWVLGGLGSELAVVRHPSVRLEGPASSNAREIMSEVECQVYHLPGG